MCVSTELSQAEGLPSDRRRQIAFALRDRGLRLTPQREAVCEAVFGCPGHICAEHILSAVTSRRPGLRMNKTTVYRALDLLMELGLVSEHKCGDGRAQYEPADRGRHSHMICSGCGQLLDIDEKVALAFRAELRARHGFEVDLESYPVFGVCGSCRQ